MAYELQWEARGVYKRFNGHVSFPEYARSQELVLGNVRSDDIRYVSNDLLEVEGYAITTEEAEYLAAFNRGTSLSNPHLRVAYVTTDLKIALLVKLVAPLLSFELKVFPTLAAARAWCDA